MPCRRLLLPLLLAALTLAAASPRASPMGAEREEALALYSRGAEPAPDTLRAKMRAAPAAWTGAIRSLASDPSVPDRLRLDAARALAYEGLSLDDLSVASQALARARIPAADPSEWLYLCQKVGHRGGDAMPCVRRLLDESTFFIRLLGGKDGIGKDYALAFLLFQMPEQAWNRELGDRLWRGVDNESSQVALLTAMFYAVSLRSDAILAKYADDPTRPPFARARAERLLVQMNAMEANATPAQLAALRASMNIRTPLTEEQLRFGRSRSMLQVSRESLLNLERYTFLIRAAAQPRWTERLRKLD